MLSQFVVATLWDHGSFDLWVPLRNISSFIESTYLINARIHIRAAIMADASIIYGQSASRQAVTIQNSLRTMGVNDSSSVSNLLAKWY